MTSDSVDFRCIDVDTSSKGFDFRQLLMLDHQTHTDPVYGYEKAMVHCWIGVKRAVSIDDVARVGKMSLCRMVGIRRVSSL